MARRELRPRGAASLRSPEMTPDAQLLSVSLGPALALPSVCHPGSQSVPACGHHLSLQQGGGVGGFPRSPARLHPGVTIIKASRHVQCVPRRCADGTGGGRPHGAPGRALVSCRVISLHLLSFHTLRPQLVVSPTHAQPGALGPGSDQRTLPPLWGNAFPA